MRTITTIDLNDLSPLYFRPTNNTTNNNSNFIEAQALLSHLPLIGPIEISRSTENNNVTEGRGLIATRDIKAGECLFVIKPSADAPIDEVRRVWLQKCKTTDDELERVKKLEHVAEIILLKKTKRIIEGRCLQQQNDKTKKDMKENHRLAAMSILSQVGKHHTLVSHSHNNRYDTIDMNVVANNHKNTIFYKDDNDNIENDTDKISNDAILSIIHRNSFGPDFRQFHSIANHWILSNSETRTNNSNNNNNPYGRILSLYPLAAMINHSCKPNAVRVFTCSSSLGTTSDNNSQVMVVHATQPIQKGEEIVWSYVPTSKPFHDRQQRIKTAFGFDCICQRCKVESKVFDINENNNDIFHNNFLAKFQTYTMWNEKATDINQLPSHDQFRKMIIEFEDVISDNKYFTGEITRYIRSGMICLYTNYFNVSLSNSSIKDDEEAKLELLKLAARVHLSLAAVDNGNTEHLSILHLCYELATQQQKQEQNLAKFWAGQLQRAHECRYGMLGNNVETLRKLMVHSRGVLRRQEGFEVAQFFFI